MSNKYLAITITNGYKLDVSDLSDDTISALSHRVRANDYEGELCFNGVCLNVIEDSKVVHFEGIVDLFID